MALQRGSSHCLLSFMWSGSASPHACALDTDGAALLQVHLDVPLATCQQRNSARSPHARVPSHVIEAMDEAMEAPVSRPGSWEEATLSISDATLGIEELMCAPNFPRSSAHRRVLHGHADQCP